MVKMVCCFSFNNCWSPKLVSLWYCMLNSICQDLSKIDCNDVSNEYSFGNLVSEDKLEDHANEIHVTLTGLSIMVVYCVVSAFAGIWTGMDRSQKATKSTYTLLPYRQIFYDDLVTCPCVS